nr:hypothetical protein [Tanacetum cinerariifolium]
MDALRYRDEHNRVGYLLKPTGSDDYHQIIDFLRASHIRYALTHNPIIFDSLVKQFWSTATLRSPELADAGGIDDLPIAEIYSGMDNLGLNFEGHPMQLLAAMLSQDQEGKDEGHGQSSDPHIASFLRTYKTDDDPFTNVEHEPLGGSFHMSPPSTSVPADVPTSVAPAGVSNKGKTLMVDEEITIKERTFKQMTDDRLGQTLGGAKDLITLTALSFVVSTLVQKVNSLETKVKDHKKLFKDVVGKLVKKVKAIEVKPKTMKKKMVVSDSDQGGGKQDMNLDALLVLANAAVTVDFNFPPGGASNNPA